MTPGMNIRLALAPNLLSVPCRWLSNVEITTHMPHDRPLWAGPQFTFKTFQKPDVTSALSDDLVADYSANANKVEISHKSTNLGYEHKNLAAVLSKQ
jgi:hypothetical protein